MKEYKYSVQRILAGSERVNEMKLTITRILGIVVGMLKKHKWLFSQQSERICSVELKPGIFFQIYFHKDEFEAGILFHTESVFEYLGGGSSDLPKNKLLKTSDDLPFLLVPALYDKLPLILEDIVSRVPKIDWDLRFFISQSCSEKKEK